MTVSDKVENLMKICRDKTEEWEERKRKMEKVRRDAEENYGGLLESGYFYFRTKDYEKAEAAYKRAAESYEGSEHKDHGKGLVEVYYGLAHTYMALDEPEKTVEYLEKAIALDPTNPLFYRDLGLIAYQNNNIEPAELFFAKAIELAPEDAELYKPLAGLYLSLGEREKAVNLYENALQTNADHPVIQQELAMIYKEAVAEVEG